MFDSMFSGPGSPGAGAGTGSVTSDFESEFADLDSLMSGQDSMSIATGEALDFLVAADPMIKEEPRIIKAATAPLFPPLAASSFGSMVIPSNDAAPAADAGLFAAAAPAVPAPKPAGKKPAQARRPRSSSTPLQYVAPSVVAPKSVHARGSSTSLADRARPVPGSPAAVQIVQADPAGPLDYLDAMLRTRLGPDPALLEDASLDAMEDAMYEEEGEEGDKKGKKRRWVPPSALAARRLTLRGVQPPDHGRAQHVGARDAPAQELRGRAAVPAAQDAPRKVARGARARAGGGQRGAGGQAQGVRVMEGGREDGAESGVRRGRAQVRAAGIEAPCIHLPFGKPGFAATPRWSFWALAHRHVGHHGSPTPAAPAASVDE
ncbi:hypothetical protein DFJ74DRAFT_661567 [Hyaloraphidium curvatum]|nr:hypothetical protein DFJ74DRAFT_661567 [Hyaloraphidium curvatum]